MSETVPHMADTPCNNDKQWTTRTFACVAHFYKKKSLGVFATTGYASYTRYIESYFSILAIAERKNTERDDRIREIVGTINESI